LTQLVEERGGVLRAHHYGSGYSAYPTVTFNVDGIGGRFARVHTGLSRTAAERSEIGIMSAAPGFGPQRDFEPWEPLLYASLASFTVGAYVHRGEMTGSWFFQVFE
jgi:hypothetical protein